MQQRTILNPAEVAEYIGIGQETLKYWRLRRRGEGPRWYKLGRRIAYDLEAVDAWIDQQRQTTGNAAS